MHGANEAAGIFVLGVLGFFTLVYAAAHAYAAFRDWQDRKKW